MVYKIEYNENGQEVLCIDDNNEEKNNCYINFIDLTIDDNGEEEDGNGFGELDTFFNYYITPPVSPAISSCCFSPYPPSQPSTPEVEYFTTSYMPPPLHHLDFDIPILRPISPIPSNSPFMLSPPTMPPPPLTDLTFHNAMSPLPSPPLIDLTHEDNDDEEKDNDNDLDRNYNDDIDFTIEKNYHEINVNIYF